MPAAAARGALLVLALVLSVTAPADARTKRIQTAKIEFKASHPCPASGAIKGPCKGYVIDHVNPLACGGEDRPENMQWQTVADGKAKDSWQRRACAARR